MESINIKSNYSLKDSNTFGIDAKARYFGEFESVPELQEILADPSYKSTDKLILGGGSNILFTKDFNGLVLKNCIKGIEVIKEDDDEAIVKSGAGEVWHDLVLFCISKNFGGLENLSLIPGTVGASPMQNIGAYGVEVKDTFESLEAVYIQDGSIKKFNQEQCQFGYRESIFKKELR